MESPSEAPPYLSFRLLVSALERYQEKHDLRIVNDVQVVQVDHDGVAFLFVVVAQIMRVRLCRQSCHY